MNVAELKGKYAEYMEEIARWMNLVEANLNKEKLKNYEGNITDPNWRRQWAKTKYRTKYRKRRTTRRIITGVMKSMERRYRKEWKEMERLTEIELKRGKKWRIGIVYIIGGYVVRIN